MTQVYAGSDIKRLIKKRTPQGVWINLDNYVEIVIRVVDKSGRVIIDFSKSGITGTTELTRIDEFTYKLVIDSSLTKLLSKNILSIGINFISEDTDLVDDRFNKLALTEWIEIVDNPAKYYS